MGRYEEYSSFEEILGMLNISFPQGKREIKIDCPVCGHHSFLANMAKNFGNCRRCGFKANYTTFFATCENTDAKTAEKIIREHFNRPYESHYVAPKKFKEEKQSNILPAKDLDKFYNSLLTLCPLSFRHTEDMYKRGATDELLKKLRYGTYNYAKNSGLKRIELASKAGAKVGIPGVFLAKDDTPILAYGKESILVPYRNRENLIVGLQMRVNNELIKTKDDSKYVWFSSKDKKMGVTSGTPVHFACDFYLNFKEQKHYPVLGKRVRITEGGMKADLIHFFSNQSVIAIPGVNAVLSLADDLKFLKKQGVETIVDTFDMDYISNDSVKDAMDVLKNMIEEAGMTYEREDWDPEFKGYDDFLFHLLNK
jgi:ribosomal protein S27AE